MPKVCLIKRKIKHSIDQNGHTWKKEIEENLVFDWIDLEEWLSTNFEAKNRSVDERAYLIFIFLMFLIQKVFFSYFIYLGKNLF